MKITDITQQAKNPKRYSIFVDGRFAFGIHGVDLLCHGLEIGDVLDDGQLDKIRHEAEFAAARDSAVKYLGRGIKSNKQVRDNLEAKEFSRESIDKVVEMLTQRGYLDDIAYAAAFIAQKTKLNNFGRYRIEQELRAKGVSDKNIKLAYANMDDEGEERDDLTIAKSALEKKLRHKDITQIAQNPKDVQKLKAFLARRGFDFETADKVVDIFLQKK
ncbi:MAG: RecX family transcriptional regulator [Defluviitaleaceae bacterium]|nr:RecX family transcriptional regulator [Defluviitaleaceae bacterium]